MKQVKVIVAGCGSRGGPYGDFALGHPDRMKVVGIAEPREFYRERMVRSHGLAADNVYTDWKDLAARDRFADAVIISTQDSLHVEPAVAFAQKGYAMLLEKPMAPNEEDCRRIVDAAIANKIIFAVCHVLRYTTFTQKIKDIIASGAIGKVISIQLFEPVGYWHQAHSFVRGNWRNEAQSSPMLLAKSCHDLDWLRYVMNSRCTKVSSFGNLTHFRKECKPAGAAERCLDCRVEADCPYSAKRFYLGRVADGVLGWPLDVLTPDLTVEGVTEALRSGPYGRCVYECDNDVVDHQVVNLLFEDGRTATFTMTAFAPVVGRMVRVFGTRGMLTGDSSKLQRFDFLTEQTEEIDTDAGDASLLGGHGGGDYRLMDSFINAVAANDPSAILSGPKETLETHLMVFAAEKARHSGCGIDIDM